MEKTFEIEGKTVGIKVSAGTVRSYRNVLGRDLITDMANIENELVENHRLTTTSAEVAENALWIMAKEYDSKTPNIENWLSDKGPYFIYLSISNVILAWRENMKTLSQPKKP